MFQAQAGLAQKKDIVFPPDSVEAIQPNLVKRRKIVSKDLGMILLKRRECVIMVCLMPDAYID